MAPVTLFQLRGSAGALFDGSVIGLPVTGTQNVKPLPADAGFTLAAGQIDVARHPDIDSLQSFTLDAVVTPSAITAARQNIAESQTPPMALFIDADGKLVGSVHLPAGWTNVTSPQPLKAGVAQRVTLTRDANGALALQVDGTQVATAAAAGTLQNVGALGLRVGMGMDGKAFPFTGSIAELNLRQGVVTQSTFDGWSAAASKLETTIRSAGFLTNISVHLVPDESHARLQQIKDIMNAAGVQTLSDLDTLPVKQKIYLKRGQLLVAPRKGVATQVDWSAAAKAFRVADTDTRRQLLAGHLTNRNSVTVLQKFTAASPAVTATSHSASIGLAAASPAHLVTPLNVETAHLVTGAQATLGSSIALRSVQHLSESVTLEGGKLTKVEPGLVAQLNADRPALWPVLAAPQAKAMTLVTTPLNSAVVIAGTLDLTNQQLVCDANVDTLYILAETVICGDQAAITWQRPGGATPARADEPDLNGRDFPGIQTRADSRDGIPGGSGQAGAAGIGGANGRTAPRIEMWVKSMTGLPNLDFNGEDGIAGGTGQRGGRGGQGGSGSGGKRYWLFGWHCSSDPGDGGDGGDGGHGGDGGRGGNGGNAGSISIGVLTGTLATTIANKSFKLKNQGGRAAAGGTGGQGGVGGGGGRSGNGETCTSAKNGHIGAQGQPGGQGPAGFASGTDATTTFFEFTQAAWDDLMTRPWVTAINPPEAFAGDTLTVHGSRFTTADHAVIGTQTLPLTINPDQSASVVLPITLGGGDQSVFVRRADGIESNRINLGIKPQLDPFTSPLSQATLVTLTGHSFLVGAAVLFNGGSIPANVTAPGSLTFTTPGTGGTGSAGGTVGLQVRNPDGRVSNNRQATQPQVLEVPFRYGQHNLSFPNPTKGVPDWGTYEDTFGAVEVMHELLDPIFGHPILTAAYFEFYKYFLKGKGNGGLATGFCTSVASLVADRFWQGKTDTPTVQLADVITMLTGVHGKLLSRQSLLTFHAQGREGISRVEKTYREIESTFLRGTDRQNAPLLFFIPAGEVWDSGYIDKLSDSHCVMPYRFVYPIGHAAPQLTADSTSTLTDPDGVDMYCWDCNHPTSPNCKVHFRRTNGVIGFDYLPDGSSEFQSEGGITLGMMRHGDYMLADHDLPFDGPFGLTGFIIDFLLSPADLEVTDANGLRTGNFAGKLLCEIPDSHPAYLMKGLYLLPASTALSRTIVGSAAGTYDYHSITPDGTSILLQGVSTQAGHRDVLSISADATQIRFTPAVDKTFSLTIARIVDGQSRAVAVTGLGGGPASAVDVTVAPELSMVRIGNRAAARTVNVSAFAVVKTGTPSDKSVASVALPSANDLTLTVTDWSALDLQAQAIPF